MKADLCPVCNGRGTTKPIGPMEVGAKYKCHGCEGKGWVTVPEDGGIFPEPKNPLDPALISFYEKKGYDVCPSCGGDRKSPGMSGCPMGSHYGTYSQEYQCQ